MISRKKAVDIMKVVAKGAWDNLPAILAVIPATAIAGKVLGEIKKIASDVADTNKDVKETKAAVEKIINANGGVSNFTNEIKNELKENRDSQNPKYINCAIFTVAQGDCLSQTELDRLVSILAQEETLEDAGLNKFITLFVDDYFGGCVEDCDYPYEMEPEYVVFNFDDSVDHDYSEEDLVLIKDDLNKILGRQVFDEYEGYGTDDSVENY